MAGRVTGRVANRRSKMRMFGNHIASHEVAVLVAVGDHIFQGLQGGPKHHCATDTHELGSKKATPSMQFTLGGAGREVKHFMRRGSIWGAACMYAYSVTISKICED